MSVPLSNAREKAASATRALAAGLNPIAERRRTPTRKNLGRAAFANGVEKFAQHNPKLVMTADNWDRDSMLLGTPGGTVVLQTGELRESRREDGITKTTSVAPLDEPCFRWLQFLNEVTGNDADLIRFHQATACGLPSYAATGVGAVAGASR